MTKTRLTAGHREVLTRFAKENVKCPAEQKARDKTYAKAAALVRLAVEKKYPPADMLVLTKYGASCSDLCIQGGDPTGRFMRFCFDREDAAPIVPYGSCNSRAIPFSAAATEAIDNSAKATVILEKAVAEKLAAYKALIASSRTYEDLLEVWPAAEALRDRIASPSTALVALSTETTAFIRNDNAGADLAVAA